MNNKELLEAIKKALNDPETKIVIKECGSYEEAAEDLKNLCKEDKKEEEEECDCALCSAKREVLDNVREIIGKNYKELKRPLEVTKDGTEIYKTFLKLSSDEAEEEGNMIFEDFMNATSALIGYSVCYAMSKNQK